jgi:hypothetical protein
METFEAKNIKGDFRLYEHSGGHLKKVDNGRILHKAKTLEAALNRVQLLEQRFRDYEIVILEYTDTNKLKCLNFFEI